MKKAALGILGMLVIQLFAPAVASSGEPLPVDRAFAISASQGAGGSLSVEWKIAEGYYLYRDRIAARVPKGAALTVETPPGLVKDDPNFGPSEIYYRRAEAVLSNAGSAPIELTYQGCQENGICYAPETRLVDPATLTVSDPVPLRPPPVVNWETEGVSASPVEPGIEQATGTEGFELAADAGLIQSLRVEGGPLLVLAMFPLFGLLLAFTPCVFPMYPILAGALAREGDRLTAGRGFILSAIYVTALALAFALLGAAAGWSGQNLQMVLQSPLTAGILAIVFVVLALSMFGLFELQLPAAWTSWVTTRTGGMGGSKRSAALLGFSSVLIVGPCVTAPLAGALLYIAQTGDVVLGAAALFGLGIGKGLPLIVLGTLGGSALPRAGAWMEGVKRVFGFGFLATAIWMATPLLPARLDLFLWAVLLIAAASFAFTVKWRSGTALATGRAVGGVALIYGAILMVGAASGATDPLKPLATLADRGPAVSGAKQLDFAEVESAPDLKAKLASANGKATLVYFTADWCVTCHTIERSVLRDDSVRRGLAGFQLIKADLTDFDQDNAALMTQLRVAGPPTMLFFDANAREAAGTRLVGDVTVGSLTRSASQLDGY
ncbi:protein-disulfide reductase DsbD [Pseudaminobacter arsenicus]|uniref:Protein-disulfide reductase DsbD n=1 Tax=Borborobacter arsenicus TaxID=1851146 RepID=A0A432V9T0_9HYPH|nr:protein-disulfide reductase DsbD [Pseudaminobacter arsenicus]RUM98958.1 protein-disulfide reductase DsbD [Pseudaminobacter arsenicus]